MSVVVLKNIKIFCSLIFSMLEAVVELNFIKHFFNVDINGGIRGSLNMVATYGRHAFSLNFHQ